MSDIQGNSAFQSTASQPDKPGQSFDTMKTLTATSQETVAITLDVFDGQDACPVRKFALQTGVKEPIGRSAPERGSRDRPAPAIDNAFFDSPVISRQHAHLVLNSDSTVSIVDVGSLHGTHVNSSKLKAWESRTLQTGDEITVGGTVITGERSFPARKFRIIYHSEPNVSSVQRKKPTETPFMPPKAAAPTSSSSTLLDPQQSTTFVVPDSSSEDCNDICSCHESIELDEDDLQIIDELSSSPVSKIKSNITAVHDSSTCNKSNPGPVLTEGPSKFINLVEPEDEEQDIGCVLEDDNERSPSIEILSHIADAGSDQDHEEEAEQDSDLDEDYHPIDDSSCACSEIEPSSKSDIVDETLPVPAVGTVVSTAQPAKPTMISESLLPEDQLYNPLADTPNFSDPISSPPCVPVSDTRFTRTLNDHYNSPSMVEPFFLPYRRNSETLVPALQPEYHSYYPVSGISQDPYFRSTQLDMVSRSGFERQEKSDPRYTKWKCTRRIPESRLQTNGKRSNVALVVQAEDNHEGNSLIELMEKAVPEIQGSSETNQLTPEQNLFAEQKTNPKKRKADEISNECPQLHSEQASEIVQDDRLEPNMPHGVTNPDEACKTQDKASSSNDSNSAQHATEANSGPASNLDVTFMGNSDSTTVFTTNEPLMLDERPTKRRRVNESWTVSEQRPRYQAKAKSSLTTFALGAVLGGVVGGISVMGALISLPDSLF